ncbi:MAG: hypothetical protein E6H07_04455 [Bacteroidetes bacterium]|nr:MAG: hypothetical protein E6H07_04455 [Bacteroidota bacterium]
MEVHHHAHTARKKWTHYFWEFLMLFLAVFCGFLAENQREHFVEHQREEVLMKSMVNDLRADSISFSQMIYGIKQFNLQIDSLIPLLTNSSEMDNGALEIYKHQVWTSLYYKAVYSDRTIEQLKNSGNFRLIRNAVVSDDIIKYDGFVRNFVISMQDMGLLDQWKRMDAAGADIFKAVVFKDWMKEKFKIEAVRLPERPYFLSTDKKQIDNYINLLHKYSAMNSWFLQNAETAVTMAGRLYSLINKEYHIK